MIKFTNISKSYDQGQSDIVHNLSFTIQQGETLVLLGGSGSGKTTALKMIMRLVEPTSGMIEIDGVNLTTMNPIVLRRSIGYVFQGIGLFPHLSIAENVAIVLRLKKYSLEKRLERAHKLLAMVKLNPTIYANRFPHELSGGEQQRVGVARALATESLYLLMDEPFGALDAITRDSLQNEILNLSKALNKTIVFVTHDLFEALKLADRIAVLNQGRLEQIGTAAELINQPRSPFIAELFQKPAKQLSSYLKYLEEN